MAPAFEADDMWNLYRDGMRRSLVHTGFGLEMPMWSANFDFGSDAVEIFCGDVILGRSEGRVVIKSPLRYPLDQLLLAYALAGRGGFILHCAGIIYDGRMWLLAGRSGAGKSTSSRLLLGREGVELVSDDRIVVRRTDAGIYAYGTPWPGDAGIAVNRCAPLGGILFLEKSSDNRIESIAERDAFERLMPVASVPWYEPELLPNVLDFCGEVVAGVPVHQLSFRPDGEATDVLIDFMVRSHSV
jgi:hypothetical protein